MTKKRNWPLFLKVSVTFCVGNFALLITDESSALWVKNPATFCRLFLKLTDVRNFLCLFIPSEDYAYNFVQWQIGVGSLWSEAIGLAPLKDRCLVRNNFGPSIPGNPERIHFTQHMSSPRQPRTGTSQVIS